MGYPGITLALLNELIAPYSGVGDSVGELSSVAGYGFGAVLSTVGEGVG
jgi:hypothetical protein